METLYKGRKISTAVRHMGSNWLLITTIWPAASNETDDPQAIQTIGVPSQSEKEAHAKALETGQRLIDANCI
ncbi:MAG: hypothetical protein H8K03_21210 [Nitrospira sp.]|jgi:hypothetical protein|nr:hypothetical protein [Nitrospira sp. BO4]